MAFLAPAISGGAGFTTADIARATLSADCVDWRIKGICLRLKCGFFGCRVVSVPWVEHRLPDLVVSSYDQPGQIPWVEMQALARPLSGVTDVLSESLTGTVAGGGHGIPTRQAVNPDERHSLDNLRFKEASVVGNPVSGAFRKWANRHYPAFCPSNVEPLVPYFQSETDALAWCSGLPEQLYAMSWNPGSRTIGPAARS